MLSEFKFRTNPMQSTAVWPASHVVIFPSIYAGVTVPWSIASIIMADDVNNVEKFSEKFTGLLFILNACLT